jgi:hypothetical protein
MTRTALYRHFDAAGALLYVGISDALSERDRHHRATAHWHSQVHRTETEWCLSREHALALEAVAIRFEKPAHNIRHKQSEPVPGSDFSPTDLLNIWPSRRDVFDDARAVYPDLDMVAVHRWFQRGRIDARYWQALIDGAAKRGVKVSAADFAAAHAIRSAAA